jgi:hypothetical protein
MVVRKHWRAGQRCVRPPRPGVPHVPAVSHLDRRRRPAGGAIRIASGPVPADDLSTGMGSQPGSERVCQPNVREDVDRAAGGHIGQHCPVEMPTSTVP